MFRAKPVPLPPQASAERAFLAELTDECDAERIRQIAQECSPRGGFDRRLSPVLSRVATHPNTPPEILAELLTNYTNEFCQNPAAPLLALDPQVFLSAASPESLQVLLCNDQAPPSLVHLLAAGTSGNAAVTQAAEFHVAVAGELSPEDWLETVRNYWRKRLQQEELSAQMEVAELIDLGLAPESFFASVLPKSGGTLTATSNHILFLLLYEHSRHYILRTERVHASFYRDAFPYHRMCPGLDHNTYARWIHRLLSLWLRLSRSRHSLLRRASDSHGMARRALSCLLYPGNEYSDASVRRALLRHPLATIPRFQKEQRDRVARQAIARRNIVASCISHLSPLAPPCVRYDIPWLTKACDWQERLIAALSAPYSSAPMPYKHPSAPISGETILRHLAQDGNRLVRAAAQARLRGEEFTWE